MRRPSFCQSLLRCFEKVFRPAVVKVLDNPFAAARLVFAIIFELQLLAVCRGSVFELVSGLGPNKPIPCYCGIFSFIGGS